MAIAHCHSKLDPPDLALALQVKSAKDFRKELVRLDSQYTGSASQIIIQSLIPALDHYDGFAICFVRLMKNKVETSMMWGLLSLVTQVFRPFIRSKLASLIWNRFHSNILPYLIDWETYSKKLEANCHS